VVVVFGFGVFSCWYLVVVVVGWDLWCRVIGLGVCRVGLAVVWLV